MSAFGVKADMPFCAAHVRLWPKADILHLLLLDHRPTRFKGWQVRYLPWKNTCTSSS